MAGTKTGFNWTIYPLEDKVDEIVIRREGVWQKIRDYARLQSEVAGFMYGVVHNQSLLIVGMSAYWVGSRTQVSLEDNCLQTKHNEFMRQAKEAVPSLTAVFYHNHPLVPLDEFDVDSLENLKQDFEMGLYDYLRDYGLEPTLQHAIAEQSRHLSADDLETIGSNGFGRYTILLSNTPWGNEFGPMNAYFIVDGLFDKKLKVTALEEKPQQTQESLETIAKSLDEIHGALPIL
ncbi:MAG: hypothetical protein AABX24_04320 [Nanoarchaeota archaeon]